MEQEIVFRRSKEMIVAPKFFRMLFSRYLTRMTRKIWVGKALSHTDPDADKLDKSDVQKVLKHTWEIYQVEAPRLSKQPGIRLWLVMNFACLTLSAMQALMSTGIARDDAIQLIREMIWQVTSASTSTANRLTRVFLRDQMRRLEYLVDLVMKVVFCKPAYQTAKGQLEGGFYMDVRTCPVAVYMRANQAADLCVGTWCAVDFGLVEITGGRLERSGTLAMGKEKCDFKFYGSV